MKLFDLTGRKAIVTGATRGLGRGMAEGLMEAGCEVVVVGSSDTALKVAQEFAERGFRCHGIAIDLADRARREEGFAQATVRAFSAATSVRSSPLRTGTMCWRSI